MSRHDDPTATLQLRTPEQVARHRLGVELPRVLERSHALPETPLAGDFILLDSRGAAAETRGRDAPLARLGTHWWVFATSGTGDAWLMSLVDGSSIAFLDHDAGPDAVPQPMQLDFAQWLQLADLLDQWEQCEPPPAPAHIQALLETISAGLAARYPYALDG
ncbi:hypothetical protein [Stenotrophomonas humi]|uniref:hypothetical protein n=1 Tax=Stenotrophomonas humi TaxID=405444 RepID=UPI000B02121C|nr:hypothetical protein [Stenotrophomonas humi]